MARRSLTSAGLLAVLALPLAVACGDVASDGTAAVRVLPATDTALSASQVLPGAELDATGRYALLTGSGLCFHRTSAPVHGLRRLVLGEARSDELGRRGVRDESDGLATPSAPAPAPQRGLVELYLWQEEQADGTQSAFYAYARDGQELLGRVRQTEYKIRLADQAFDPLLTAPSELPMLAAATMEGGSRGGLVLVQFHATPLPAFAQAIAERGGKVLRFLSDHTYLVEIPAAARASVAGLPYVRYVGPYLASFRLEPVLREAMAAPTLAPALPTQRYSIMLGEGGATRQAELAARITAAGGHIDLIEPGGMRIEATLPPSLLLQIVGEDSVQYIDRWGGPGETDMDLVREVGGANALETMHGWTGQGVRGEVFDTEVRQDHQEWANKPIVHSTGATSGSLHGSSCFGINFAQGKTPGARGMLPSGQGIFFLYTQSTQFGGMKSRYDINRELTDPMGSYRAVFQTSSVGSSLTTAYTTLSAETDDYLFKQPILSTQSQSNAGSPMSRPQAWSKNIVSVGAVRHFNTPGREDDTWRRSGSTGPAADGRIKPDLAHYFDSINTTAGSTTSSYTMFSGTSAATPITGGHFGLLFQMWHEGVWAGHGKAADVFASRPAMATAKALMINTAYRYDWRQGGPNGDIDRNVQGWGTADLKRLLGRARSTLVIDESAPLKPLGCQRYVVSVRPDEAELVATLVFTDPMGTVGAAQARVNDLSLRLIAPDGRMYWGNAGLRDGNSSIAGGASNTIDTVENVIIPSPLPGRWIVEVLADEIVKDGHPKTTDVDAVYGLVVSGIRKS
ncbi:MAG TPA: S8 family serine peptidase [Pseudomonadota bacterium]|nr:S8 family serine peptidase [Pseudomonadota bacterium]